MAHGQQAANGVLVGIDTVSVKEVLFSVKYSVLAKDMNMRIIKFDMSSGLGTDWPRKNFKLSIV